MADGILVLFGGAGYLAPIALFAAGAVVMLRPMLPAVQPWGVGALCLGAALTLGLAAGSLGLGPGDTPRDGFVDAEYLRQHGGLVGESLFWVSSHLFSHAGSHILFVFLLLAGVLLLTGASVAGVVSATRQGVATTTERVRVSKQDLANALSGLTTAPGPAAAGRGGVAARARGLRARGARHPRGGARAGRLGALPRPVRGRAGGSRTIPSRARSPSPELELDLEPAPEPPAGAGAGRGRGRGAARADTSGPPPLGGHRVGRDRLQDAEAVVPQALERRSEGRHQGHRAHGRPAGGDAQPLQRGRQGDRNGHRPARHALRAAPGARHQDVEGRHAEGRPRLRPRRRAGAHPRAHPGQAGGGRGGAQPRAQDGAPRRRVPGGAEGLVAAVGLARQGHRRQGHRHRPRQAAPHPDRRNHRVR